MEYVAPGVLYLNRFDWGANPNYPRLGGPEDPRGPFPLVPRDSRVYNIFHHTVGVDTDTTKNVWESLAEITAMMRRLQLIRPDLGNDVPYNFVLFLALIDGEYLIVVCEGRGYDRWGAHTAGVDAQGRYFNGAGIATSWAGNFEDFPVDFSPFVDFVNNWLARLRRMLQNIGTVTICGRETCGHKDFASYSPLNQTACCGKYLYAMLAKFRFDIEQEEDDIMVVGHYAKGIPWDKSYVVTVGKEGARKTLIVGDAGYQSMLAAGFPVTVKSAFELRKIISTPGTPEP